MNSLSLHLLAASAILVKFRDRNNRDKTAFEEVLISTSDVHVQQRAVNGKVVPCARLSELLLVVINESTPVKSTSYHTSCQVLAECFIPFSLQGSIVSKKRTR